MPIDRPFPRSGVMAAGTVVGLLWLAMAFGSLWASVRGYANDRLGWGLAWGLVGILLLAGGIAAIVGTWYHLNRVARPER